jgi:hypothetical protein
VGADVLSKCSIIIKFIQAGAFQGGFHHKAFLLNAMPRQMHVQSGKNWGIVDILMGFAPLKLG